MNTSIAQACEVKPTMHPCLSVFLLSAVFQICVATSEVDCRVRFVDGAENGVLVRGSRSRAGMAAQKSGGVCYAMSTATKHKRRQLIECGDG